ncbi:MAG: hypothetical protein KGL97_02115 [Alphaproteobacteria bacterium]|nr:hypothetical protein [Alphaproteobacteria bacterium]
MRIEPEISGASVVLLGSFEPRIFTPYWFAYNNILTAAEADAAEVEVIHSTITVFRMKWLSLRVEEERLIAETTEAPFIRLSDLVVRTFREFLNQTPIGRMGINRTVHFNVGDEATRNQIGRKLAPLEPWGEWGKVLEEGDALQRGGMINLTMQKRVTDDRDSGHIHVSVQPSVKIRENAGIFVGVNDHYEVKDFSKVIGCDKIIAILSDQFQKSILKSEWIVDQIMALKK